MANANPDDGVLETKEKRGIPQEKCSKTKEK